MNIRGTSAAPPLTTPLRPTLNWWYTLAHAETSPAQLSAQPADILACADALAAQGETTRAVLLAQVARETAHEQAYEQALQPGRAATDGRCVWAFRRLADALTAARANHRSDYHAYPQPCTLREAALDRLYQRFPLDDYPHTTVLLFTGLRLCDDPRLCADPRGELALALAEQVIGPEQWERFTLCGFRQGVSLVRAPGASRWLRVSVRALEDAWALGQAEAQTRTSVSVASASAGAGEDGRQRAAETLARDTLLRSVTPDAFMRLDDAQPSAASAQPLQPPQPRAPLRPITRAARLTQQARRHAV